jgi:REP element-mobilizing transposase RayT
MRTELAGGVFHVTMRGNARATIFHHDHDYDVFLRMLRTTVETFEWLLHSWCVLPNHFHRLVETPHTNLGRGMLVLNGSYARRYNAKFDRVGHVFQTPYRSKLVATDEHFTEAVRYIANNPVRAKLCARAADWSWGSYRATSGLEPKPPFLTTERIVAVFGSAADLAAFVDAKAMSLNVVAGHG